MKTVPIVLAIAAAASLFAGNAALAQDRGAQRLPQTRAEVESRTATMFDRLDADSNDRLTEADLESAPFGAGDRIARMMERADSNDDGAVSRAEFTANALARFDAVDSNKDGTLSPDERRAASPDRRGASGALTQAPRTE